MPLDRKSTRLPKLGEDWKAQPENIDPATGKPYKRRTARLRLTGMGNTATTTPATSGTNSVQGGRAGQGGQYDPAASGIGGARTTTPTSARIPGATQTGPGPSGSSPVEETTLGGEMAKIDISKLGNVASDDVAIYGQLMPGGSGSAAANEYARLFPVGAMGAALGGGDALVSNQDYLAAGQDLASMFGGGAGQGRFLNPVEMMQNIFDYAMNVTGETAGGQGSGGPLAAIAQMDPGPALNAFLTVVQGALTSTMPEDVANAYVAMLQRIGTDMIDKWFEQGYDQHVGGSDVIQQLFAQLGPNLGLAGGNAAQGGGGWQGSSAQQALRI